jgi:hypothetical protein
VHHARFLSRAGRCVTSCDPDWRCWRPWHPRSCSRGHKLGCLRNETADTSLLRSGLPESSVLLFSYAPMMPSCANHQRGRVPSQQEPSRSGGGAVVAGLHGRHLRAAFLMSFSPIVGVTGACGLVACAHSPQPQLYAGPRLSPTQVARITKDDYARILKVDEQDVYGSEFEVLPGCHTVSVAYAVTFHKATSAWSHESVASVVSGLLTAHEVQAANTKTTTTKYASNTSTTHETINPILFAIDMKPSIVYWFKATFNGSDFFPEVVEQDEANRSFPAGVHCPSPQARDTAR